MSATRAASRRNAAFLPWAPTRWTAPAPRIASTRPGKPAPLPRLLDYAAPFLRPRPGARSGGTGLFHRGRGFDRELTDAREKWNMRVELMPSRTDPTARILRLNLLTVGGAKL